MNWKLTFSWFLFLFYRLLLRLWEGFAKFWSGSKPWLTSLRTIKSPCFLFELHLKKIITYYFSISCNTFCKKIRTKHYNASTNSQAHVNPSRPNPGRIEKIKLNFYFHPSFGTSKGFMKTLKAFIKPFETPRRSVKIKIYLNFYFNTAFRNARDVKS